MHDEMLAKLLAKKAKSGKILSDNERQAKMDVLKSLDDEMSQEMGDKVKNLKKVTVASDSSQGLEKGLEKAKKLLAKQDESAEPAEEEMDESSDEEESEDLSLDELDAKIRELEHLKKMKLMSK